jgi:hypothetical protein
VVVWRASKENHFQKDSSRLYAAPWSLERHLKRFDLPLTFTEWASLAQDRAGWHKRVTHPPFEIGKPFTRQPRGDTRVTPEEKRRRMAQHKAETEARRAAFNANAHQAPSNS